MVPIELFINGTKEEIVVGLPTIFVNICGQYYNRATSVATIVNPISWSVSLAQTRNFVA